MTGSARQPLAALLSILLLVLLLMVVGACDGPPVDDVDAGPPAPDRFATTECTTTTTNPAAEVIAGVGFAEFEAAAEETVMPVVDVDGLSYAYFSVRVRFTELSGVCLQYRLDIAEPDEPNEALAFDRYLLDLEPDPAGGGIVRGIAAQVEDPDAVSGKRVLLVLDVADGTISGTTQAFATLQ
jgi:hypothetical protein